MCSNPPHNKNADVVWRNLTKKAKAKTKTGLLAKKNSDFQEAFASRQFSLSTWASVADRRLFRSWKILIPSLKREYRPKAKFFASSGLLSLEGDWLQKLWSHDPQIPKEGLMKRGRRQNPGISWKKWLVNSRCCWKPRVEEACSSLY